MKKLTTKLTILAIFLAIFAIAQTAAAQTGEKDLKNKTPQERAQFLTDVMTDKLQLSEDQVTKVSAINLKYALQMDPVLKSDQGKMMKMKKAMGIQKNKNAELKTVFTPEQNKQYEEFEAELKDKLRERAKNRQ